MKGQFQRVVVLLLFVACLAAILFFLPKDFEKAMGSGFDPGEIEKIQVHLSPMKGDENYDITLNQGERAFGDLLAKLQAPDYSRTMGEQIRQVLLDYDVSISFVGGGTQVWAYSFWGQDKIEAGPGGKMKTYQISGGQETQQAILDYLLTLEPDET